MNEDIKLITPGNYSETEKVEADSRRCEFDIKNEQILYTGVPVDIDFAGDSLTHFMEENQFYHKYGYVVNRGIGGDQAQIMAWRFAADVTQLRPRLCIMLIGCNNLWVLENSIDEKTGDYTKKAKLEVLASLEESFRKMLDEAKSNGIAMWVGSVTPHGTGIANYAIRNPFIKRVNNMLEKLVHEYGGEFIDYFSNMTKEDGLTLRDGISREGIHPNHIGYELMRQVLEPKLDKFFGISK